MSRSLNKVMLIGNLTRDPELRYTPSGTAVCTFGLATNRSWTPSNGGERKEETEFHRIVSWQKLAELCAQLLFKGRKVYVEGRLQTRNWTTQNGEERITTEVVIDNMIVLDAKRKTEEEGIAEGEVKEVVTKTTPASANDDVQDDAGKPAKEDKKEDRKEDKKEDKVKEDKVEKQTKKEVDENQEKEEVKADDIPF